MKKYQQCRLRQGPKETTGWIEVRGAKKGKFVELSKGNFWEVAEAFGHVITEDQLKESQQLNRNSLPSVEGMR